jgi:hypothetical protein
MEVPCDPPHDLIASPSRRLAGDRRRRRRSRGCERDSRAGLDCAGFRGLPVVDGRHVDFGRLRRAAALELELIL